MIMKTDPETMDTSMSIFYRSSFYAVSSYYVALLLEKMLMASGAVIYGYSVTINYKETVINADPSAWSQESVLVIYFLPILVQAVLIVIFYIKLQNQLSTPNYFRIFSLWIMFFMAYRVLGLLSLNLYNSSGVYHAMNWLYVDKTWKILAGIAGLGLFLASSARILKGVFFFFGAYNNNYQVIGLKKLLIASLFLPLLATCVISVLFLIPGFPPVEMAGLILIAIVIFFSYTRLYKADPEFLPSRLRLEDKFPPKRLFFIMLPVILALRIILGIGITIS